MLREGKGMGNLRLVIPGIPGIPGNHIKSKVKFNISFIFMPWPAIRQTANNDSISRLNSQPKIPFPGNGKGNYKMPREGKGTEIWGLYSRESPETGIPAHPCHGGLPLHHLILVYPLFPSMSTCHGWLFSTLFSFNISLFNIQSEEICEHGEKVVLILDYLAARAG